MKRTARLLQATSYIIMPVFKEMREEFVRREA